MSKLMTHAGTGRDDLLAQGKTLGDPTRFGIFCCIFEGPAVGVAEPTGYMQLIHNAVRRHLEAFSFAGLITASLEERRRPGWPSRLCRTSPEGDRPWAYSPARTSS